MRDLPHHIKKLNRRVVRSAHREELEDESYLDRLPSPPPRTPRPKAQVRKQAKSTLRKEREARTPSHLTPAEKNQQMKHRVPIFDRTSKVKVMKQGARATKKKTPRI